MCSVVGSNNSVDSDVSVSSESEDAMSDSAQSSGVFEVSVLPSPPPVPKILLQLWILMSEKVLSLRLLCQILLKTMTSFNTLKMLRLLNLRSGTMNLV